MRRIWRIRARRAAGEDGFTLVEVMVAMTVLAIAIAGLAQLAGAQMVLTLHLHQRQAANAVVAQQLEALHSASYATTELDPSVGSPPSTYTDSTGTTYPVVLGTSGCAATNSCFDYTSTVSSGGFSFALTQVIVGVGGSAPNYNYKRAYVSVASTSGPKFTYATQTDITAATTNTPQSFNSLTINLQGVTSNGSQLTDSNNGGGNVTPPDPFAVSITGASSDSGNTADGSFNETTLSAGTYTCTVTNSSTSLDWLTYPGLKSTDTFSCTDPSQYTSEWEPVVCNSTAVTGGANGSLSVTVVNATGTGLNGVNVTLVTPSGSLQTKKAPGAVKTNSSGIALFNGNVPPGPWTVNVGPSGGPPAPGNNALNGASACVWGGQTSYLNLAPTTAKDQIATLSVAVQNTAPGGTSTMELEADGGGRTLQTQMDVDAGTTTTMSLPVEAGTTYNGSYAVTLYCTGVGGSSSGTDGKVLTTWTTSSAIGSNGTWSPTGVTTSNPAAYEC